MSTTNLYTVTNKTTNNSRIMSYKQLNTWLLSNYRYYSNFDIHKIYDIRYIVKPSQTQLVLYGGSDE